MIEVIFIIFLFATGDAFSALAYIAFFALDFLVEVLFPDVQDRWWYKFMVAGIVVAVIIYVLYYAAHNFPLPTQL